MKVSAALCLLLLALCGCPARGVAVARPPPPLPGLRPVERALELDLVTSAREGRKPGVLDIYVIRGQLGDSLRQLAWGILYAEGNNYTSVTLSWNSCKKHFLYFLDILPENHTERCKLTVSPPPEGPRPGLECRPGDYAAVHSYASAEPSFVCNTGPEDFRRVFLTYFKPLLNETARVDKQQGDPDELVLHMRGGDAMTTNDTSHAVFEMRMLPCAFYDKVIESGPEGEGGGGEAFGSVRIIAQDMTNPCVKEVQARHPDISLRIQSSSREEDAAAMMNARYLVADQSYFPYAMALFNEEARTLWYADCGEGRGHLGAPGRSPLGGPEAKNIVLSVPGLQEVKTNQEERINWMVGYPKEQIIEVVQ